MSTSPPAQGPGAPPAESWPSLVAPAVGCAVVTSAMLVGVGYAGVASPSDVIVPDLGRPTWWLTLAVLVAQASVLLGARRAPRGAALVAAAAVPLLAVLGAEDATSFGVLVVLVASYAVTVRIGGEAATPALLVAGVLVAVGSATSQLLVGEPAALAWGTAVPQALVAVGLPAAVGLFVRARRDARAAQRERVAALEREHEALVQVALSRERMAMARELHDIAAHHLTGIAVMSGVMERQIEVAPADAKVAVRQVREQSTAMLREMRGLVALLREPGDRAGSHPAGVETLAGIPALVQTAVAAGTDAHLSVLGTLAEDGTAGVGPLAQLAAYRTVQECLSNAARHAPGARCDVVVDVHDPAQVVLTVSNAAPRPAASPAGRPPGGSGGFGLVGMRERAELTDSRLAYGPTPDGGWRVTLTIPVEAEMVTTQSSAGQGPADGGEESRQ